MGEVAHPGDLVVLAANARGGDEQALERFLAEVHVHIRRYFKHWLYHRREWKETVEDLAQETLIKVARGISGCMAVTDVQLITWCCAVAANVGIDYLRVMRDEWELTAYREDISEIEDMDSDWRQREIEVEPGMGIMLHILRETQTLERDDTQQLLWHRLVLEDEWSETGWALGVPHTAAKRRFQRAQTRVRRAVLEKLIALPPGELSAVRRWMERLKVSEHVAEAYATTSVTRSRSGADA